MQIKLRFRRDNRIKIVELKTGTKAFLVPVVDFNTLVEGMEDYDENIGEISVDSSVYSLLWKGRVSHAEPHSFRFRRS